MQVLGYLMVFVASTRNHKHQIGILSSIPASLPVARQRFTALGRCRSRRSHMVCSLEFSLPYLYNTAIPELSSRQTPAICCSV